MFWWKNLIKKAAPVVNVFNTVVQSIAKATRSEDSWFAKGSRQVAQAVNQAAQPSSAAHYGSHQQSRPKPTASQQQGKGAQEDSPKDKDEKRRKDKAEQDELPKDIADQEDAYSFGETVSDLEAIDYTPIRMISTMMNSPVVRLVGNMNTTMLSIFEGVVQGCSGDIPRACEYFFAEHYAENVNASDVQSIQRILGDLDHRREVELDQMMGMAREAGSSLRGVFLLSGNRPEESLNGGRDIGQTDTPTPEATEEPEIAITNVRTFVGSSPDDLLADGSVTEYKEMLETFFGYNINVSALQGNDEQQIIALQNLAQSSRYMVEGFDSEDLFDGQGQAVFQDRVAEQGQTTIYLGAENLPETGRVRDAFTGLVNPSADDYNIYLGSEMTVGAITSEFIHQLDRAISRCEGCIVEDEALYLSTYLGEDNFQDNTKVPLHPNYIRGVGPYENTPERAPNMVIQGYVGQYTAEDSAYELLGDLGMTYFLHGRDEEVLVETEEGYQPFNVGWANTTSALRVEEYLTELFREVLKPR